MSLFQRAEDVAPGRQVHLERGDSSGTQEMPVRELLGQMRELLPKEFQDVEPAGEVSMHHRTEGQQAFYKLAGSPRLSFTSSYRLPP